MRWWRKKRRLDSLTALLLELEQLAPPRRAGRLRTTLRV
jgi:hypothetical protein